MLRNTHNTSHNHAHQSHTNTSHTTNHKPHASSSSSSGSTSSSGSAKPSPGPERAYTQEQLVAVQRVRKLKDYYAILEISKDASEADIKKAYRKVWAICVLYSALYLIGYLQLALIMHPDKNSAPGAEEAFKGESPPPFLKLFCIISINFLIFDFF